MSSARPKPQPGDVQSVESGEPEHPRGVDGGRVVIRLHQHRATYIVRVATARGRQPYLTELLVSADGGAQVDHEAVRAIPVRRLAYTAAQWLQRAGGLIALPDDTDESYRQPENHDPRIYEAARIANRALSLGQPVRPTVAAELGVSTKTVDRLLKRAKAEQWFDDAPLPKRPSPRQRDTTTEGTDR